MDEEVKIYSIEDVRANAWVTMHKVAKKYEGTPYYVDIPLSEKVIKFISILKHTGGKLAGVNFQLLPFQVEYVIETLCVLQHRNGYRKHTTSILHVPRKQGKTELLSAINLVLYFVIPENQREQYVIASETKQASILYSAVVSMLKQTPALLKRVNIWRSTKTIESKGGMFTDIFTVLTSNADTKDGLKASTLTSDEAHAYPDSSLYDVMTESMAHREQPLSIIISTSGYLKQGFFHKLLGYAKDAMAGKINDPYVFLMSFAAEEDDDWTKEETWVKCNPALGYGVKIDYLRSKCNKAMHSASDEVSFKTKHLNMWVDSAITWIKSSDWTKSNTRTLTEEDLAGRECYGGLDLASTTDLAAFVLVFPDRENGSCDVVCRFFVPEDNAKARAKEDKVLYLDWIREGYITATPGNVIDYDSIEYQIKADCEKFDVREIAFDRWNSHALVNNLMNDEVAEMVGFGQGYKSMSSPVKNIEALVLKQKLNHRNNPVLTWNVGNVLIVKDAADNVKIDKSKAREKVDGAVALAMAMGRADVYKDETVDIASLIG